MTRLRSTTIGVPQPPPWPYRERWLPVYQVHRSTRCYLCQRAIPRALGIAKGGGRARAFWEPNLRLVECVPCREEDGRLAGLALEAKPETENLEGMAL